MKKMMCAIAIIIVFASIVPASAQVNHRDDGMGIYFDLDATFFCYDYSPLQGLTEITAYLMLTRPSTPQPSVLAWEARLEIEGNPLIPIPASWIVIGEGATHYGSGPDYIVGVDVPITGSVTMLAYITLTFIGYEVDPGAAFTIGRIPGSTTFPEGPGYTAEVGNPIPAGLPAIGDWSRPSAYITWGMDFCNPIIPNKIMTWGAVKSLYED